MRSAEACFFIFTFWLVGVCSCLAFQSVRHLYIEAKICEAVACEALQDTKTDVKNIPPPALTKKG